MSAHNPTADLEIDIGPRPGSTKTLSERMATAGDWSLIVGAAGFIAGSASLVTQHPDTATVLFLAAGKVAQFLATVGLTGKIAPVCLNACGGATQGYRGGSGNVRQIPSSDRHPKTHGRVRHEVRQRRLGQ